MLEYVDYRGHVDPEYRRWGRLYPRFPGVGECVRLIGSGKARGAWADIIAAELARHACETFEELTEAFHADGGGKVRQYVMMALELAALPRAVPFLAEVLRGDDPALIIYAERALRAIDTREARKALWDDSHKR